MEEVAPDIFDRSPLVEPPAFARGAIQSMAYPKYCADTMQHNEGKPVGLYACASDILVPQSSQHWVLSNWRDIRKVDEDICFDAPRLNQEVLLYDCHYSQGNQLFRYDLVRTRLLRLNILHGL